MKVRREPQHQRQPDGGCIIVEWEAEESKLVLPSGNHPVMGRIISRERCTEHLAPSQAVPGRKVVIIETCDDCPFFDDEYYDYRSFCTKLDVKIEGSGVHPDCPLPDATP